MKPRHIEVDNLPRMTQLLSGRAGIEAACLKDHQSEFQKKEDVTWQPGPGSQGFLCVEFFPKNRAPLLMDEAELSV